VIIMDKAMQQRLWVERVLGYRFAGPARGARPSVAAIQKALALFDAAQREVDSQIGRLQQKLAGSEDAELRRIAEFGLNAVTGNTRVRLQGTLMELRARLPEVDPKLASNAGRLAEQMVGHLTQDVKVRACDRNPFDVRVSIVATLGGAARQLQQALQQAA
jgi:hypothetical protein